MKLELLPIEEKLNKAKKDLRTEYEANLALIETQRQTFADRLQQVINEKGVAKQW